MVHDPYWDLDKDIEFPPFDASKTALLIIDMQKICAHPDGWMGRLCVDQGKPGHLDERLVPGWRRAGRVRDRRKTRAPEAASD